MLLFFFLSRSSFFFSLFFFIAAVADAVIVVSFRVSPLLYGLSQNGIRVLVEESSQKTREHVFLFSFGEGGEKEEDERYVGEYMQQLVPMHLVVSHHHRLMLDIQHTQIRHYSRRARVKKKRKKCGKKKKKERASEREREREKKKRKEMQRKSGRWKENERRGRVGARKNLGIVVIHSKNESNNSSRRRRFNISNKRFSFFFFRKIYISKKSRDRLGFPCAAAATAASSSLSLYFKAQKEENLRTSAHTHTHTYTTSSLSCTSPANKQGNYTVCVSFLSSTSSDHWHKSEKKGNISSFCQVNSKKQPNKICFSLCVYQFVS